MGNLEKLELLMEMMERMGELFTKMEKITFQLVVQ